MIAATGEGSTLTSQNCWVKVERGELQGVTISLEMRTGVGCWVLGDGEITHKKL